MLCLIFLNNNIPKKFHNALAETLLTREIYKNFKTYTWKKGLFFQLNSFDTHTKNFKSLERKKKTQIFSIKVSQSPSFLLAQFSAFTITLKSNKTITL